MSAKTSYRAKIKSPSKLSKKRSLFSDDSTISDLTTVNDIPWSILKHLVMAPYFDRYRFTVSPAPAHHPVGATASPREEEVPDAVQGPAAEGRPEPAGGDQGRELADQPAGGVWRGGEDQAPRGRDIHGPVVRA